MGWKEQIHVGRSWRPRRPRASPAANSALCALRIRFAEDRDVFTAGESARLRFLRWLVQTLWPASTIEPLLPQLGRPSHDAALREERLFL